MINISQISQSSVWGDIKQEYVRTKVQCSNAEPVNLENVDYKYTLLTLLSQNSYSIDNLKETNRVEVYGVECSLGDFLAYKIGSDPDTEMMPIFGKILKIFIDEKNVLFFL